jgi:D-glycero-D-manno-heptose 1,7-bisphosphate phosphatase
MHNSALFPDRDGVINVDHGYVHRSDQFEFVPGIFELARFWTNEVRRPIVVVTNQSGIGRGYARRIVRKLTAHWRERSSAVHLMSVSHLRAQTIRSASSSLSATAGTRAQSERSPHRK